MNRNTHCYWVNWIAQNSSVTISNDEIGFYLELLKLPCIWKLKRKAKWSVTTTVRTQEIKIWWVKNRWNLLNRQCLSIFRIDKNGSVQLFNYKSIVFTLLIATKADWSYKSISFSCSVFMFNSTVCWCFFFFLETISLSNSIWLNW